MKKNMSIKNNRIIPFVISSLTGIALFLGIIALCAVWTAEFDTKPEKYTFFLIAASFAGAFISSVFTAMKCRKKRFFTALGQGSVNGVLFLLFVSVINGFSLSPIALVVPAAGIIAGLLAGVITANLR